MSEISILNGYKIKDKKAVRYYDSISNMKSDTTLKAGMYVKTKGYYESDDGGSGEYIIVDDDTLVDDGGSIHVLTNGLRAKLIINDKINILQFGAKKDGSEDIGNIVNTAINNGYTNIYLPKGDYLVSTTIDLDDITGFNMYGEMFGTYKDSLNATRLIGNTGALPMISLIGARHISLEKLCLISTDDTETPSTLGILQGCSTEHQYSQWINLTNIHINLISSETANSNNGSIGIYNWQSELNSYINVFAYADIPVYLTRDDELQIAQNNGAILPVHDSLTGNNYTNLETQSKKEYTICIGGESMTFTGFYGQGTVKFLTNSRGDYQTNNIFIQGVVERNTANTIGATFEITPRVKLQRSYLNVTSVRHTKPFYCSTSHQRMSDNIFNIAGNFSSGVYADSEIQFVNNIIYKGSLLINNIYSQGNIILGGDVSKTTANSNLSLLNDGTIYCNGVGFGFSDSKPTRTDLPDNSLIINTGNNRFVGWKYKASTSEWLPVGVGVPVETDTGSISVQTPLYVGQLLHNVSDNSMWISYATTTGAWKQITN